MTLQRVLGTTFLVAGWSTMSAPPPRAASTVTFSPVASAFVRPGAAAPSSALKPINQGALQTLVDDTAKELLVPGAVVLLRTPQGEFVATYGITQLGASIRPRVDTHFRIASNTKTMTAAVIMQLMLKVLDHIYVVSPLPPSSTR